MISFLCPRAFRRICTASIAAFIGSVTSSTPLVAQTPTEWSGTGADTNWSTAANWNGPTPAQYGSPQFVRDLLFGNAYLTAGGTGSLTSNNDVTGYEGWHITFQDTVLPNDPAFIITGNAFTLSEFSGNAPRIANLSGSLQTFNLSGPLTLDGGSSGFAEISLEGGDLLFSNPISLLGTTQLEVTGNTGHTVTFNGAIGGGAGAGLILNGGSRVVLGAANTYGGDTRVNAGNLVFTTGGSIATGTSIRLGASTGFEDATLTLDNPAGGVTVANNLIVHGGSSGLKVLAANNTSGTNTFSGNITLQDNLTLRTTAGGTLEINTGTVDLSAFGLRVDGDGIATISSVIQTSAGAGGLTKTGTGTLTLSGNNTFSGGVIVEAGILNVASDANLGNSAGALVLRGGTLNATGALNLSRIVALDGSGGTVTLAANSTWTSPLIGPSGFTKDGAGSLTLAGTVENLFEGTLNVLRGTVALNNSGGNAIGIGGASLTSSAAGASVLSLNRSEQLANSAPLTLNANGGQRAGFNLNNFTESVGLVTISSTTNGTATILLGATGRLILANDLVFNANRNATGNTGREVMITGTGTYATTGVGGTVDLGGVARNIFVNTNNTQTNSDATIESEITNGTLVKEGPRVLRLGAVNTFGGLVVRNGAVRALVDGAIPANIPLTVSATASGTTATLDFNGFNYTLTPANNLVLGGGSGANVIAMGTGTLTLATDLVFDGTNNPQSSTISGNLNLGGVARTFNIGDSTATTAEVVISAAVSGSSDGIIKIGDGTLALSGTNTYTGPVIVNAGAFAPRSATAVGGPLTINPGAALQMDAAGADSAAYNNFLGPAGNTITIDGGTFRGMNNSDRTVTGRVLNIGPGGATFDILGNYNNFVESGVTQVRFAAGTNTTILSGSAQIVKDGGGRIQFQSASPNFSGPIVINNGTFEANGATMGNSSPTNTITINGGNLALTGDSNQPIITLNGGGLSITGASRTTNGLLHIAAPSYVFLNNFWTDASSGWNLTLNGVVSGNAGLTVAVNRAGYDANSGALILRNPNNTLAGTVTIGKNVQVTSNPTSGVGSAIGTANFVLQGGKLNLRDNGAGNGGTLNYGNSIVVEDPIGITANGDLAGTATITVGRVSGSNIGNTVVLGALTIGGQQLDVTGANLYNVTFAGAATMTGNATFNVVDTTLTLASGLDAGANTFTKSGSGTLRILSPSTYGGFTHLGGTLELPNEPGGVGRTLDLPFGIGFSAGYVATQANLIDRITFTSAGVVGLGVDSTFNPDFTGFTNGLRLGGSANATLTGTITSADGTVRLGGGGGTLTLTSTNAVGGAVNLDVNTNGTAPGTIVLAAANNFSGPISVAGGMVLRAGSNASLGTNPSINLDNGTVQLTNGGDFNSFNTRVITAGAGGATIDTNGTDSTLSTAILGTGNFTKAGAGTLTLTDATATFVGKTIILGGKLSISSDANLGAVPAAATNDQIQLAGGTLLATQSFTIPANRRVALGAGGGTIEVADTQNLTLASILSGANPFTKEGLGTLTITADPSANSSFIVNNGVLALQHSGSTDAPFIVNNGGTLRTLTANDLGDAFSVTLNQGGTLDLRAGDTISQLLGSGTVKNDGTAAATLSVNSATNATFTGVLQNGTAALGFTKTGANTVILTNVHTHTGNTTVNNGLLSIEGSSAAILNSPIIVGDNNGGDERMNFGLTTDVWSGGALNRIGDTSPVTLNGRSRIFYTGPHADSTGFNDVTGALTVSAGANTLTLIPAAGADVQLSPASLLRTNNGSLLLRGQNLGGSGPGSTRLVPTATPLLIGGAGGVESLFVSIVPFVLGDTSETGAGTSFVTTGPNGLRVLSNTEYAPTIAGQPGRNVSTAGGETVSTSTQVNALRVSGGTTTIAANTKLQIASGAVLITGSANLEGPGTLDFDGREGIINIAQNSTPAAVTINTSLAGGNGIAIGAFGFNATGAPLVHSVVLGGSNTFGGPLTLNGVATRFANDNVLNPTNPVPVIFRPGASLQLGGHSVTIRDLGAGSSGGTFTLQNAADTEATLTVLNTASSTWASPISNGTGTGELNLWKTGPLNLTMTGASTYTGSTTIERGAIILSGAGRLTTTGTDGSAEIVVGGNGILRLTNTSGTSSLTDRLRNDAPITMTGGVFDFDNTAVAGTNYSEIAGALILAGGFNTITSDQAASANTTTLTFASLTRTPGFQAVLNFSSQVNGTTTTGLIGATTRDRIVFTTEPTLNDGLIGGWAFVDGTEFATYNSTGVVSVAAAPTTADAQIAWDTTKNVKPGASITLDANRVVNSLNFASGESLNLGGFALNVDSGGVIHQASAATDSISNGTITAGTVAGSDLVIRTSNTTGNLTLSAAIVDNGAGAVGLNKTGPGKLTLTGANTYTGPTSIGGVLSIASDSALGAVPATATPGHLRLNDGGMLEITAPMTLHANRGIELTGASGTINQTTGNLVYNGNISSATFSDLSLIGNIELGGTLSVGGLNVAFQPSATPTLTSSVVIKDTDLVLGANRPGAYDLNIGYRTATPSNDVAGNVTAGVLDLRGLTTFTANMANIRLGVSTAGANAQVKGDLLLASTSNITASLGVLIGDSTANVNNGFQSTLQFGSGANKLNTPSIVVGGRKGSGRLFVEAGGSLELGGSGSASSDLRVAFNNQDNTGVTSLGTADFSVGTLIADLDELVVGFKNGAGANIGGATGTVTLGNLPHLITANEIRLGDSQTGSTGTISGTLDVGGGLIIVRNDVQLGLRTGTAGTGTGVLNLTAGSMTVGGNITTSNSTNANSTVTLDGGSLDVTGGFINVDTLNVRSGTLRNVGQIFTGDGTTTAVSLNKDTPGILAIEGTNTYSGNTNVNAGTLRLMGSLTGGVNVASGAILTGEGLIGGAVTIATGASLVPGVDIGSLATANLVFDPNSLFELEINTTSVTTDFIGVAGDLIMDLGHTVSLNITDLAPAPFGGNFTIISYSGDWNGGLFNIAGNVIDDYDPLFNPDSMTVTIGDNKYHIDYDRGGDSVALVVPEPTACLSILGGLGVLLGAQRVRRRR